MMSLSAITQDKNKLLLLMGAAAVALYFFVLRK